MAPPKIILPRHKLVEYMKDGKTDLEISELLYCSESTVLRNRRYYGLARVVQSYDKDMYLRLKELGLTETQVEYAFGCSHRQLSSWKSRIGLTKRRNSK